MSSEFEQFTKAVSERSRVEVSRSNAPVVATDCRVTVLGGDDDGRLLAALCLAQGAQVTLFSAYGKELQALHDAGGITLRGEGPIGTFQVNQEAVPSITTTAELDHAVTDADLIFLTGPVHKQRTYAMVLADHLVDSQTLILTPARSFAALETQSLLQIGGCTARVTVVELQQLPHRLVSPLAGGPMLLSPQVAPIAASLPANRHVAMDQLRALFPTIQPVPSVIDSSFYDASGVVEAVALLFGHALVNVQSELPVGAVALQENQSIRALLDSPPCRSTLHALLGERRAVASRFGVRNLPDDDTWIAHYAGDLKDEGRRPVPTPDQAQKLIRCAVTGSLVPLQSAAAIADVSTPLTDSVIVLASKMLGTDLTFAGRQLSNMGVTATSIDDARAQLQRLNEGAG